MHLSEHSSAWDACAPDAILRAAGGEFTDLDGKPFEYGGEDLKNRAGILACNNAETLEAVLPSVREIAAEKGLLSGE